MKKFNKNFYIWLIAILSVMSIFAVFTNLTNSSETHAQNWISITDDFSFTESGNGSEQTPYLISTSSQLATISKHFELYYNKHIKLANDINLNGYDWTPFGSANLKFSGVFDGNGYKISGLKIQSSNNFTYAGLFAVISTGTVKNLFFENLNGESYIVAKNKTVYAGMVAGIIESGIIDNVHNLGAMVIAISTEQTSYAGGLVGSFGSSSKIRYVINKGNVYSYSKNKDAIAGGIIGQAGMVSHPGGVTITNAINYGNIFTYTGDVNTCFSGGLIGYTTSPGLVQLSYNNGHIYAGSNTKYNIKFENSDYAVTESEFSYAGGIVGYATNNQFLIKNVYNTGNVKSDAYTFVLSQDTYTRYGLLYSQLVESKFYLVYAYKNYAQVYNYDVTGNNKELLKTYHYKTFAYAGGIAGYMVGNISYAYSSGNISGGGRVEKMTVAQTVVKRFENSFLKVENEYLVQFLTVEWKADVYSSAINGNRGISTLKTYANSDFFDYKANVQFNMYASVDKGSVTSYIGKKTEVTISNNSYAVVYGSLTNHLYFKNMKAIIERSGNSLSMELYFDPINNAYMHAGYYTSGNQIRNYTLKQPNELLESDLDKEIWVKMPFVNKSMPVLKDFYW